MKRIQNIFFIIISLLLLNSCKKELDQQPKDTFSDVNAFISFDDVQKGLSGAYGRYGAYANDMYVSALLSDEATLGANNTGAGVLTYRYQFNSDLTTGNDVVTGWGDYYALIDQVNRVLPFVSTVTATPDQEPRRVLVKAELQALRGIAYFGLLQSYTKNYDPSNALGVPVLLVSNASGKPARNTVGEVMAQIDADLSEAKAALPAVTPGSFSDTIINRINIAAYQARIALYKKDYVAAIAFSTEVIASGIKPLVSGADFEGIWTDDNNNETLFRIRFLTDNTIGTLWSNLNGTVSIAPSNKLIASYDADDIRSTTYIGVNGAGNPFVNKFFTSSRGGRVVDIKACRIAEMYLIRAEANARTGTPDLIAAAQDLNDLRSARIAGYVDETFSTSAALVAAVLEERFKELAFEGFRFFDLKRNNLPVERLASDAGAGWQTLPASSNLFVLPIPRSELNANPNMVQNEGY